MFQQVARRQPRAPVRAIAAAWLLGVTSLAGTGCAARTATQETTGAYLDDTAVTANVRAALLAASNVDSGDINIETYRGNVQLSGFVDDQGQIDRAMSAARRQAGVKSVKNDLRLKVR